MAAAATRTKPNAFNAMHQLQRRLKQGDTMEQVLKVMEGKQGLKAFGFSAGEGAAVVNLVHHIPPSCREIFAAAVCEFGIIKGPVTHAALGHPCMRPGFQPELIGDDWSLSMKNTSSSVILAGERLVMDFKDLPPGMRKSAGAPEAQRMTRICRAWELVLQKFGSMVPQKLVEEELPGLTSLFRKRIFDDWLYTLTEECPATIDLNGVAEMSKIIAKHQTSIEKALFKIKFPPTFPPLPSQPPSCPQVETIYEQRYQNKVVCFNNYLLFFH